MNWTADFPILAADENGKRLVYLDSAATTQHPTQVLKAVVNYYNKENANPHRGVYEPVSYTHLDVYKRQRPHLLPRRPRHSPPPHLRPPRPRSLRPRRSPL